MDSEGAVNEVTDSTDHKAEELETEDRRVSPDEPADESGQSVEIASEGAAVEETGAAQGAAVEEAARETADGSEKNADGESKLETDKSPPAGSDPEFGAVDGTSRKDDRKEAPPAAEQPKAGVVDGNGKSPEVPEKIADDSSPIDKETGEENQEAVKADPLAQAAEAEKGTIEVAGETQGRGEKKPEQPAGTKATTKVKIENGQDAQQQIFDYAKQVNNYYGYKSEEGETESKKDLGDPTIPLPSRASRIPALGLSNERGGILAKLKRDRTILLSSRHHQVALGAAYSIIDDTGLSSYQKRALAFDGSNRQREIPIDYFIDRECEHSGAAILVDIQSQIFFDSLQCSHLHAGNVRQLLAERKILLICAVEPSLMEGVPSGALDERIPFEVFTVPFLRHLLGTYFNLKEARELEAKIHSQHERGLWGEPGNDADLYERIQGYSINGAGGIREAVEKREGIENRASEPGSLEEIRSLEEIQPVKASDLFRVDDPVVCVVLYVATYFKRLSPQELSSIVTLLLGEQAAAESVEKVASKKKKKKKKKRAQEPDPRLLKEIWNEDCDDILDRCSLHVVRSSSGNQIIDFDFPHLRKELRKHLEARHPMFLQRQFRRLQESRLLFERATPLTVQRNLIRLSVERTIADPQYYDANWMIGFVLSVRDNLGVEVSASDDPAELAQRFIEALAKGQLRGFFYTRLSDLIREMLKYPRLQRTVHDFLANLVALHLAHNEVLDLVLRLAHRLRLAPHFDPFFWLKRLIDEGGAEIKPQIYNGLHRLVLHNGLRIYEVLGALESWLPKESRLVESYSPSNHYALSFIVDYCRQTATAVPAEKYGQWPSRYPLFAALTDDDKTADERLDLLARWLFHPGLVVIFDQSIDIKSARSHLIVGILELWILILEGLEPGGCDPKANRVADALLDAVSRQLDRPLRRRVYRSLQTQQKKYGQFASWTPPKNRALRRELRQRRRKVMTLRQRLVHFEKSSPSTRAEGLP